MRDDAIRGGALGTAVDDAVDRRTPFVAAFVLLVFAIFVLRLFQLQLIEGEKLGRLSAKNSVRTVRLDAPRGDIVDREGRTLATTRPAFGVQVIPNDLQRRERTFEALGMLLDDSPERFDALVGHPRGRGRFAPVRVSSDVTYDELARVESHRYALPGVITDVEPRRDYVEGDLAAHTLGYIGEIQGRQLEQREYADYRPGEVIGQAGVEQLHERDLRGRQGRRNVGVDVAGLRQQKRLALLILGPGTLLPAALIAVAGRYLLGLSWPAAAILGASLASTDPVLLRTLVRHSAVPPAAGAPAQNAAWPSIS